MPRVPTLAVLGWLLATPGCTWNRPHVRPPHPAGAPVVVGEDGPLSPRQSENAVDDAVAQARYRERAEALVKAVQAATGTPLITGNRTRLLVDGPDTYAAMRKAIGAARHSVHVETYMFEDGEAGSRFAELLARKRAEGVTVRVIYDAVGSLGSDGAFFDRLAAQGVEVAAFRPLHPATLWRAHNRDHRKLVIVDGRVGFIGGVNISDAYARSSATRPGEEEGKDTGWRDTHVELHGPAVKALQTIFLTTWRRLERSAESGSDLFPDGAPAGDDLVQVVASDGGDSSEFRIYDAYMSAIAAARAHIWITQAYFAPNEDLREALVAAAARGVDVRIIVPGFTDHASIFYASRATYAELLAGGVKLFEYGDALLHAKTAVVDGIWSAVGSCNLDPRSFAHDNEANVAVVGREFGRSMEAMFQRDLQRTTTLDAETWAQRPLSSRMKEFLSSLFSYWL